MAEERGSESPTCLGLETGMNRESEFSRELTAAVVIRDEEQGDQNAVSGGGGGDCAESWSAWRRLQTTAEGNYVPSSPIMMGAEESWPWPPLGGRGQDVNPTNSSSQPVPPQALLPQNPVPPQALLPQNPGPGHNRILHRGNGFGMRNRPQSTQQFQSSWGGGRRNYAHKCYEMTPLYSYLKPNSKPTGTFPDYAVNHQYHPPVFSNFCCFTSDPQSTPGFVNPRFQAASRTTRTNLFRHPPAGTTGGFPMTIPSDPPAPFYSHPRSLSSGAFSGMPYDHSIGTGCFYPDPQAAIDGHALPWPPYVMLHSATVHSTELHNRIVTQIEYYFSEQNLIRDDYLRGLMDDQGWVLIERIAIFNRINRMTAGDIRIVFAALKGGGTYKLEVLVNKLRKRQGWDRFLGTARG